MEKRITLSTLVLLAVKSRPITQEKSTTVAAKVTGGYATVNFSSVKEKEIRLSKYEAATN